MNMRQRWLHRLWQYPLLALLLAAISGGGFYGYLVGTNNFNSVIENEVYRARQISGADIVKYKKQYDIQSIINLRGDNTGSPWYDDEALAAQTADVQLINFRMSARRELSPERMAELVELMRNAPKPLLIHCRDGADRTGLASALYLAMIKEAPTAEAARQLSWRYGHVPLPWLATQAMDRSFENYLISVGD